MTQGTAIKIGDTVAWADVPDGAMVRTATRQAGVVHALRIVGHGRFVSGTWGWREWDLRWEWSAEAEAPAWLKHPDPTIIALGLTGFESAEDLQRMAEVFDIRQHLDTATGDGAGGPWVADEERFSLWLALPDWQEIEVAQVDDPAAGDDFWTVLDLAARTLHAAGWRAGMLPSAAAHLLVRAAEDRSKPQPPPPLAPAAPGSTGGLEP